MLKNTLILLMLSFGLLGSVQGLKDMHDRLKNRVIHVETLSHRGRWLWQNDNKDKDGSRYLWIDLLAERDTYYTPRVQFKATECGKTNKYLCFESVSLPHHYLTAGFPAAHSKYTVKLQNSFYVHDDERFHWKVLCETDTMDKCKFEPIRFLKEGYVMIADNWGSDDASRHGGHYDATLGKDKPAMSWFRVHAPNPTDGYKQVYSNRNTGSVKQEVEYSTTIGVSQTQSTTRSITTEVSFEIGGAFKAFSLTASTSISTSWEHAQSSTYEKAKTVTHKLTVPPRTMIVLKQLIGSYAGQFKVADDQYLIEETPLDGGKKITKAVRANSVYIKL